MKHAFLFILYFPISVFGEINIDHIRSLFEQGIYSECKVEELLLYLEEKESSPITTGYIGASKIILARHAYNPVTKYNYFIDGKALLESSIQQDSLSPELRYLRLIIQTNVPWFLNYNKNQRADKLFLQKYLETNSDSDVMLRQKIKQALNLNRQKSIVKN